MSKFVRSSVISSKKKIWEVPARHSVVGVLAHCSAGNVVEMPVEDSTLHVWSADLARENDTLLRDNAQLCVQLVAVRGSPSADLDVHIVVYGGSVPPLKQPRFLPPEWFVTLVSDWRSGNRILSNFVRMWSTARAMGLSGRKRLSEGGDNVV